MNTVSAATTCVTATKTASEHDDNRQQKQLTHGVLAFLIKG
jgi:hypothetical protein